MLIGLAGLLFGLRDSVSWLGWYTPEVFAIVESIVLMLTGVSLRAAVQKTENAAAGAYHLGANVEQATLGKAKGKRRK